tara:strand:- start:9481 stop:10677 length:1197 start_codon:yes stop_codon:yes gene_type:complete
MTSISRKGLAMPESPIRKLVPFAEKAKKRGINVFHLNIGQPDINSPELALEAINNFNKKIVEYSHSAGFKSYRKGLVKYYKSKNIELSSNDILVTTGGSEALFFTISSCLDHDEEVIIPEPFYANYNGFAKSANVKVRPISTSIKNGFKLPLVKEFEKLINPKTKAILICNPGNPTGYLYSKEDLNQLKEIVLKHNLFLIADEVYREFTYDGLKHNSILNIEGLDKNAIVIDSTSKRYSMCGIRIGCLVSKNNQVISTCLKFAQARLSPPTFGQIAAQAALSTPDDYFTNVIDEYVSRRDLLVRKMNDIDGVVCPKPSGAFYAIAELPVDDAEDFCQWMLDNFSYKGDTVMLAPAAGFYSNHDLGKKQVRVAYVLNRKMLSKAVDCIRHALEIYTNKL